MKVEMRIERLRALHAGEATAEPYIWPVFFKVDSGLFGEVLRSEAGPATEESFEAPGGDHGNIDPMRTGEEVEMDMSWTTDLTDGDELLGSGQSIVGLVAILFEEDLSPGDEAVRMAYDAFVVHWKEHMRKEVAKRIAEAGPSTGPYSFDYRRQRQRAIENIFDPIEVERALTKSMPKVHSGILLDRDDFIGAMVWCISANELRASGDSEFTKLWTPTTGSEEGSWELDIAASHLD